MEEETQEYLDGKADTPADDEMLQQDQFKAGKVQRTCHKANQ